MTSKESIIKVMEDQGKTKADLAHELGVSQAVIWDRLKSPKNNSLTVKKFNEMLRVLGYELVIMPRAKANKIDNAIVICDEVTK